MLFFAFVVLSTDLSIVHTTWAVITAPVSHSLPQARNDTVCVLYSSPVQSLFVGVALRLWRRGVHGMFAAAELHYLVLA